MGGKGSGGTRVGAGRKKKEAHLRVIDGGADKRGPQPSTAPPVMKAIERFDPPATLPAAVLEVWNEMAPHAFDARTLTRGTAVAFRDLCEAIVLKRLMLGEIQADGLTHAKVTLQMDESGGGLQAVEKKAHPLLSQLRGTMQRVEAGLLRFRLSPCGKELYEAEPAAANPLDRFLKGKAR